MKKLSGLFALLLLSGIPAMAQYNDNGQRFEAGAGYTFRSFNVPPAGSTSQPRVNMNGVDGTFDANVNDWFGVAVDADWTHFSSANGTANISSVVFGPQFYPLGHHTLTPFAHALFGLARAYTYTPLSGPFNDGSFVFDLGGGVDVTVTKHVAIRVAEFDYEQVGFTNLSNFGTTYQSKDFKVKAGILFRFGEK